MPLLQLNTLMNNQMVKSIVSSGLVVVSGVEMEGKHDTGVCVYGCHIKTHLCFS